MVIAVAFWIASVLSGYLGWHLRGLFDAPKAPTDTPLRAVTLPTSIEQQDRVEQDKREAILTQRLQSMALQRGHFLSPMEASAEAREMLAQL